MNKIEKGIFLKLLNRNGYVLDFSTNQFDNFTMESVGVALCAKYKCSKGRSLTAYLEEATDDNAFKLLSDFILYYETTNDFIKETNTITNPITGDVMIGEYSNLYHKCKEILAKYHDPNANEVRTQYVEEKFSTPYMKLQFDIMLKSQNENPAEAIGKAKEVLESCCKTILTQKQIDYSNKDSIQQLASNAFSSLKLMPNDIEDSHPNAEDLKQIYGHLKAMVANIAKLRNAFGTGHRRELDFISLEPRHARLIVGASITIIDFLWSSFEEQNK